MDLQTGAISYSDTFNGTFKTDKEWTTDPAWILYDLLTETRAGCGIPEANLDKFCDKCQSGPILAEVKSVNIKAINLKEFSSFKIIY